MNSDSQSNNLAIDDLFPILEQLEQKVTRIEARIYEFVPRRHITDSVKYRHIKITSLLGGRCSCCGINKILDGENIIDAEFDHFYSRERREFEDTWLICKPCHLNMKERITYTDEFRSYQRKAKALENGQLSLNL